MLLSSSDVNHSFIRMLRVVRMMRSIRMLRLMRFAHLIRKLRVMTLAIINCSMMLMWAMLILFIVTFLFSVVFLNAASQYIADATSGNLFVEEMRVYFSSLFMTMLTLFMAVAGGIDWWDVLRLLLEIHVGYAIVMMLFVVINVLAVLNVINAIFVNDAMESTRTDHDLRMQGELEETKLMLERLTKIFELMEKSESGVINDNEFVEQVEREDVRMQFALLGLHFTDARNFFRLLDIDGSHSVGIDEFVMGCLSMKGGALLIDTRACVQEMMRSLQLMSRSNKKAFATITSSVKELRDECAKVKP